MNILYCGDSDNAPLYVQGALENAGHSVLHVPPYEPMPSIAAFETLILSDYPASSLIDSDCKSIINHIAQGNRLIMLGGWESFNGFGRNYYSNAIGQTLLPVTLRPDDDRVNAYQGLVLAFKQRGDSAVIPNWETPPLICGYNDAKARDDAEVLVEMRPIKVRNGSVSTDPPLPLVVKRAYKNGTVLACLTDLAPHWSGGLTDWGSETVQLSNGVEVGDSFLKFVQFLLDA